MSNNSFAQRFRRWFQQPLNSLAFVIACVPFVILLLVIHAYFVRQVPHIDQWTLSEYIAMRAKGGHLTLGDLFIQNSVHRHVFSNVLTAILAVTTNWYLPPTFYISPIIGLVQLITLVVLMGTQKPRLLVWVLGPFSLLVFYPTQYYIWLFSLAGAWVLAHSFLAAAVGVLVLMKPSVRALALTGLLTVCANFTFSVTFPLWILVPGAMWLCGYRQWRHYAFWLTMMVLTLGVYFLPPWPVNTRLEVLLTDFSITAPTLARLQDLFVGFFVYMTASLIYVNFTFSVVLTLLGFGLFAWNLTYLVRAQVLQAAEVAPWVLFAAYAVAAGGLLLLGRATSSVHPIDTAKQTRFFSVSIWYWRALFALCVISIGALGERRRPLRQRLLWFANVFAVFFIVAAVILSSVQTVRYFAKDYGHGLLNAPTYPNLAEDICVRDYPLYRDDQCFPTTFTAQKHMQPDFIYELAVYRLALFDQVSSGLVLPQTYQVGHGVIVSTPSEWLNLYVRDFMLVGVPPADQLHLAYPARWDDPAVFPQPLQQVIDTPDADDEAQINAFIQQYATVWYLTTPETASFDGVVRRAAAAAGYQISSVVIEAAPYQDAKYQLFRIEQLSPP